MRLAHKVLLPLPRLSRFPSASAWDWRGLLEQFWWDLRAETRHTFSSALELPRKAKDAAKGGTSAQAQQE